MIRRSPRDNYVAILIKRVDRLPYRKYFPFITGAVIKLSAQPAASMYAENALPIINAANKAAFIQAISSRLDDLEKESKRKRGGKSD